MTSSFLDVALGHLPADPSNLDPDGTERLCAALRGARLRAHAAQSAYAEFVAERLGTKTSEALAFAREVPRQLAQTVGDLLDADPVALAEHDGLLAAMGEAEADAIALVAYARRSRTGTQTGSSLGSR